MKTRDRDLQPHRGFNNHQHYVQKQMHRVNACSRYFSLLSHHRRKTSTESVKNFVKRLGCPILYWDTWGNPFRQLWERERERNGGTGCRNVLRSLATYGGVDFANAVVGHSLTVELGDGHCWSHAARTRILQPGPKLYHARTLHRVTEGSLESPMLKRRRKQTYVPDGNE